MCVCRVMKKCQPSRDFISWMHGALYMKPRIMSLCDGHMGGRCKGTEEIPRGWTRSTSLMR